MVLKSIKNIQKTLPEVLHIVMFYNNGTVFQTTFEHNINIPKIGENLAEAVHHMLNLFQICNYNIGEYKKLVFEAERISVIILKLGEDSNLALFFKSEDQKDIKISSIRNFIEKIEELVDMDKMELDHQIIHVKEAELIKFENELSTKLHEIGLYKNEIEETKMIQTNTEMEDFKKKIDSHESECEHLRKKINELKLEISILKQKIVP